MTTGDCPADCLGRLQGQDLGDAGEYGVDLDRRELVADDLKLLINQVRHHLRNRLGCSLAEQVLLRRVAVAEANGESKTAQLGEISKDGSGAHPQCSGKLQHPYLGPGRGHREDHQQAAQTGSPIHVSQASMALQLASGHVATALAISDYE